MNWSTKALRRICKAIHREPATRAPAPALRKFTLLIDFGSSQRIVGWSGADVEEAKHAAWAALPDAEKARVRSITPITSTGLE